MWHISKLGFMEKLSGICWHIGIFVAYFSKTAFLQNFFQKNIFHNTFSKNFVPDEKIFGNKNAIKRDFSPF